MDPVLNAQVQSPFVRTLSSIPSKTSSYVHGIPDNVPPFSYNKIEVQPYTDNSTTSQALTHKFRIPQGGILNRAYLKIRTKNFTQTNRDITESVYTSLFTPNSGALVIESNYDAIRGQSRIPWRHDSQNRTRLGATQTKGSPFGTGGAVLVGRDSVVDPQTPQGTIFDPADTQALFAGNFIITDPSSKTGTVSNGWNVVNVLDQIQLSSNGKVIETIPGECIPAEVVKMQPQLRDFYTKGMIGYQAGDDYGEQTDADISSELWDPSACARDCYGRIASTYTVGEQTYILRNSHVDFTVPVPLSSLRQLSKNYDTKFVEDMELSVSMKELDRGFNYSGLASDGTKSHTLTLVLMYHNFHDSIYNSVRDSNFKRGVPASVYSHDWNLAATGKWVDGSANLNLEIKSRKLVTELIIVAKQLGSNQLIAPVGNSKSDYTFPEHTCNYKVELVGSGRTIVDSTNKLLQGPDSADYDLETRRLMGNGVSHGGTSWSVAPVTSNHIEHYLTSGVSAGVSGSNSYSGGVITQSGVDVSFGENLCSMRFGFQTSDEYYSGGLALQTISNPTIIITPFDEPSWAGSDVEFNVYVKHALMVRIDSGTGAITRTLDV